jgi:hypothetical protein
MGMGIFAKTALLAALLCLLSGGCANLGSIHHHYALDGDGGSHLILIDAKQRAILTARRPLPGLSVPFTSAYRAFCTEPSPDVFSVLSQAASASGSFGQDATAIQAALNAAFSNSETGSTIPRTQTVNMLREMMYRTCERYISGALDENQFSIQAIRDQHTIVSILAIEQLTGTVTPSAVALTSAANAVAGQGKALSRLDDAWKANDSAGQTVAGKTAALAALDQDKTDSPRTCKELHDAATPTEAEKKKLALCTPAEAALKSAQDAQAKTQDHLDTLKAAASGGSPASASASGGGSLGAPGAAKPEAVAAVTDAVVKIVDANFQQDEFVLFCVKAMDKGETPQDGNGLAKGCFEYLKNRVARENAAAQAQTAALEMDAARYKAAAAAFDVKSTGVFETFWSKVVSTKDAGTADVALLQARIDAFLNANPHLATPSKDKLTALKSQKSRNDVFKIFSGLAYQIKRELAK